MKKRTLVARARTKLTFPLAVTAIQLVFLLIFYIFGDYDEGGAIRGDDEQPNSKDTIQEYYPSKLICSDSNSYVY